MSIDSVTSEDTTLYDDLKFFESSYLKAINCIPVVNIVSSIIFDYFHIEGIGQEKEFGRIVKWIESKNEYKMYNLVGNGIAAVVTLAYCITGVFYTIMPTIVFAALALQTTKEIIRNWQVIDRLNHPNERLKSTVLILVD